MRKKWGRVLGAIVFVSLLAVFMFSVTGSATVLHSWNFDGGQIPGTLQKCTCATCNNVVPNGTYTNPPIRLSSKSNRFELVKCGHVVNSSYRTEVAPYYDGTYEPLGTDRYYAISNYLPNGGAEDYQYDDYATEVFQFHQSGDTGSNPFGLVTQSGRWKCFVGNDQYPGGYYYDLGAYTKGVWYDWVFHIRWGWNASYNPIIEIYRKTASEQNYSLIQTITGPNTYTGQQTYNKFGIYKWNLYSSPVSHVVIYDDEYKTGTTFNDVAIGGTAPTPTPTPTPIPGGASMPYYENFEDSVANNWSVIDGTWNIITDGTKVYQTSAGVATSRAIVSGSSWTNYDVTVKVKVNSWGGSNDKVVGIMGRYQNATNYYLFIYNHTAGQLRIVKQVSGVFTNVVTTSYSMSTGTWYTFKAVLNGTSLKLEVNGTQMLSTTDSGLSTGSPGLISCNADARYDYYSVFRPITIDGQVSPADEWNYTALATAGSGNSRSLKATNDAYWLYVAVEGSSLTTYPHYDIYINSNDYMVEDGTLYDWNGSSWTNIGAVSASKGSTAIEVKIPLSSIAKSPGNNITLQSVCIDASWNWVEMLPRSGANPSYTIK